MLNIICAVISVVIINIVFSTIKTKLAEKDIEKKYRKF